MAKRAQSVTVEFTECPVMVATLAAHELATKKRVLYDDGALTLSELEAAIANGVEALGATEALEPREIDRLLVSARMAARLATAA